MGCGRRVAGALPLLLIAATTLSSVDDVGAFTSGISRSRLATPTQISNPARANYAATKIFMSTQANAMDRLSDSCVKGIALSQDAAKTLQLASLDPELLMVGMIRSSGAENMEIRKILTTFGISPDGVKDAAQALLIEKGLANARGGGADSVPFADATKKALDDAVSIAGRLSPEGSGGIVLPGHVLLALLEFDDRYSVATELDTCAGLAVLRRTAEASPVARAFDTTNFCRSLIEELKKQSAAIDVNGGTKEIREREVVEIGGGGPTTPTLEKVGVDLTNMAQEGRLDPVYGRENEIKMCLRTLGRRRKSNPCLIGEPGM